MKIITLVENTRINNPALEAKHGLSLYIEQQQPDRKLLFDIGPDNSAIKNAELLGVDLAAVEMLIISHAHRDHTGGLADFLRINQKAPIYLLTACQGEYFSKQKDDTYKKMGLDIELFSQYKQRFHFFDHKLQITKDITLLAPTTNATFRPRMNANLYKGQNGQYCQDLFEHELILTIMEHGNLTVFTGCAHYGILNMILSVEQEIPNIPIKTVIGGFHLANPSDMKLAEEGKTVTGLATALNQHKIQKIYTGHCTGDEGFSILQTVLNSRIEKLATGSMFES
jgi:7,8-dihydropterin-6-yl-methyl-4-(beta-D-ribofuranosyl)aminobenzene 5'-phosphate synthase